MNRTTRLWYYGKIHEDARTLGILTKTCDKAYRNVLKSLTGKTSCKDLDANELRKVNAFLGQQVYLRMPPVTDEEAIAVLS